MTIATIDELIKRREEIRSLEAKLSQAIQEVTAAQSAVDQSTRERDAARRELQVAQDRLKQLTVQESAAQAELQSAQDQVTALTAQLDAFTSAALAELRQAIDTVRSLPGFSVPGLDDLDGQLAALQMAAPNKRLAELPPMFDTAQAILERLTPVSEVQDALDQIGAKRRELDSLNRERDDAIARVAGAQTRLTAVQGEVGDARLDILAKEHTLFERQQALNLASSRLKTAQKAQKDVQTRLDNVRPAYETLRDGLIGSLETDVPLALFPVRLETRYMQAGDELWVRIYPDDLHQDSHEPELTQDEITWGQRFWTWWQDAQANPDPDGASLQAWGQLCSRFGAARAAWIARTMKPSATGVSPQPPERPANWTRAAHTVVLPDLWLVLGYVSAGGNYTLVFQQWSEPIRDPLPTGPSPEAGDQEMQWMVDFPKAVEQGMALRVTLGSRNQPIDRLIVLGVKATLSSVDSARRLAGLLEAHRYTWGLDLAAQGTPTNNTPELRTGYAGRDPGFTASFDREFKQKSLAELRRALQESRPAAKPAAKLDVEFAAEALDVPLDVFDRIASAGAHDQEDARNMNAAFWPASWHYFLRHMMHDLFDKADLAKWEAFVVETVRARGPLPALRLGNQPYGLLPVTALDRWQPHQPLPGLAGPASPVDLLLALRKIWQDALPAVPFFARPRSASDASVDPDKNTVEMLGMDATSHRAFARRLLGPAYRYNLWLFLDKALNQAWRDALRAKTVPVLGTLSLTTSTDPFLAAATYDTGAQALAWPLVCRSESSETEPLPDGENYLAWLATETPRTIHDQANLPGGTPPKTLLYRLLRHATLAAYSRAALQIDPQPFLHEPELIDIWDALDRDPSDTPTATLWRHLAGIAPFTVDHGTRLHDPTNTPPELRSFLDSLKALSLLPTAALERLTGEALDITSHRLDAWITSCATDRLRQMRSAKATGIHLGGYGWVENLQPRSDTPVSTGYIHAPSPGHAATAAVLRSGYLSHQEVQSGDLLAVDLSSRRVRLAEQLIDGVRNGQPLAALLGYRFERGLHERHMDMYIAPIREDYPLVAGKQIKKQDTEPLESIAARNVVDGLALHAQWLAGQFEYPPVPTGRDAASDQKALAAELQALHEAVDAVSDLALAESVHHVVQGNPLRAGTGLDALSRGDVMPAEIEVARTPRTGVALTHRIIVLFPGEPDANDDHLKKWAHPQPRGVAEPYLNAWAARLLGDPACVLLQATYDYALDAAQPTIRKSHVRLLSLMELDLCPLDVLYWPEVGDQLQQPDVEQWIAYHAMASRNTHTGSPGDIPAEATLQLRFQRDAAWQADQLSVPEILEVARAARELIFGATVLDAPYLEPPGTSLGSVLDGNDLKKRADQAVEALKQARKDLKAVTAGDPRQVALNKVREKLIGLARFGVPGAAPQSVYGDDDKVRASLLDQAERVARDVDNQLAQAKDQPATPEGDVERLRTIFGRRFLPLPRFLPDPKALKDALERRQAAYDATADTVTPWFQRVARVRAGAERLDATLLYAEAIGAGDTLNFRVAQLPVVDNDRWVALDNLAMTGGKTSLVMHTPLGFDPAKDLASTPTETKYVAGLLIDEWVEVVPSAQETTAVAFHYDAPGAQASQAILLAVPPDPSQPWDIDTLATVLNETFDLAKLRLVDPDALAVPGALGHYLPALYFVDNRGGDPNGDTISATFDS